MNTHNIPHPSTFIDAAAMQTIQQHAAAAEQLGTLHEKQLDVIYQNKWFNLYVPEQLGGLECTLEEALQIEEAIAYADGSTGWTVTLCSGANWFVGFLDEEITALLFNHSKVCFAGSGRAAGIATDGGDHYIINGSWNYASGASIATAFTANCHIKKDGKLLYHEDNSPVIQSFIFLKEEVTLLPNWKYIGMVATASNGFEVKQLKVSKNRSFVIGPEHAVLPNTIFQYPFLPFAETTLAVNHSGMACRFFELCREILEQRIHETHAYSHVMQTLKEKLINAEKKWQWHRTLFYAVVNNSWNELIHKKCISPSTLQSISSISRELAAMARHFTDELYPYCGLAAANPANPINRVWRDLHTASQHVLLL
ncbi:MAG: acyl-CoA dehydrogenase [Bacteroidetes bacterium]|nr:acyl-CoA dehydrogenase [Bacteroidota bacterium]